MSNKQPNQTVNTWGTKWVQMANMSKGVRKIAPRSGSGFGLGLALELGLGGNFPRGQFSQNLSKYDLEKLVIIYQRFLFLHESAFKRSVVFTFCVHRVHTVLTNKSKKKKKKKKNYD